MGMIESEDTIRAGKLWSTGTTKLRAWLTDASEHSRVQRLAGAVFMIRVGSAVLAYVLQVFLARWMGSFEFGIYAYAWTWVMLLGYMVDFGIASSAQRFVPEYTGLHAFHLLRGFLSSTTWMVLLTGSAMAALGAVTIKLVETHVDPPLRLPLYLSAITLPLFALGRMQESIARCYDWVNLSLLPTYVLRQLALLLLMGAGYLAGVPMAATSAMIASFLAVAITATGQRIVLSRRLAGIIEAGSRSYDLQTWLATSLPLMLVEGFYLLLTYTDVVILQQFEAPDVVGVYYAATKTLALVAFVYFCVSATNAHKFTALQLAGDRRRFAAYLARLVRLTFWPSLALTVVLLVAGRFVLGLFGSEFVGGYHLLFLLAIGLLARASIGPAERLLSMLGEQRICASVYAVAFATNVALCFLLIPRMGAAGAAIATSSALVVESILLFLVTKERLEFHMFVFGGSRA